MQSITFVNRRIEFLRERGRVGIVSAKLAKGFKYDGVNAHEGLQI